MKMGKINNQQRMKMNMMMIICMMKMTFEKFEVIEQKL